MKQISIGQALAAATHFCRAGALRSCAPYGQGHINATFLLCCSGLRTERYILQAVNTAAFPHPEQVMENIVAVTEFLQKKEQDERRVMHVISTVDGAAYYRDGEGNFWRMYRFAENTVCLQQPESEEDFLQCAVAFGSFQRLLADYPAQQLHETIPGFHDTPARYRALLLAAEKDVAGRGKQVKAELEFFRERASFYPLLQTAVREGELPLRVTHNDTKCNNVLLDAHTRKALCVIDLDTVMPGISVHDFGDAIRFGAVTAQEDERISDRMKLELSLFGAYVRGYLEGCGGQLLPAERRLLPEGALAMTLECGMRFLADYLSGDCYFRIAYPAHNLVRCRTQMTLAADMEAKMEKMRRIVLAGGN